jgi:hypothetical protein
MRNYFDALQSPSMGVLPVKRKTMRAAFVVFFAAFASASAQNSFGPLPSACGPKDVSFDVRLDKAQHPLTQPEPGKSRIYLIHDIGAFPTLWAFEKPIMLGFDGAWLGANLKDSYFSVSIDPGEHHICAATQYNRGIKLVALAHLQVEAGKTYFYRTRFNAPGAMYYLELDAIDSDEGEYLIASYPLSVSHPKN